MSINNDYNTIECESLFTNERINKAQGAVTVNEFISSILTLNPDNDTYVSSSNMFYSYYKSSTLKSGEYNGTNFKTYFGFDGLKDISYDVIRNVLSIKLVLHSVSKFTGNINLYSLDKKFSEDSITWLSHPEQDSLITSSNVVDNKTIEFDVTDHVKAMLRKTKVLRGFTLESEDYINVYSSNINEDSLKPQLIIEYNDTSKLIQSSSIYSETKISLVKDIEAECNVKLPFPIIESECLFTQDSIFGNVEVSYVKDIEAECSWVVTMVDTIDCECLYTQDSVLGEVGLASLSPIEAEFTLVLADSSIQEAECILIIKDKKIINAETSILFSKDINVETSILLVKDIDAECRYLSTNNTKDIEAETSLIFNKDIDVETSILLVNTINAETSLIFNKDIEAECKILFAYKEDIYAECRYLSTNNTKDIEAETSLIFNKDIEAECKVIINKEYEIEAECNVQFEFNKDIEAECKLKFVNNSEIEAECDFTFENKEDIDAECKLIFENKEELEAESSIIFSKEIYSECGLIFINNSEMNAECNIKFIITNGIDAECSIIFDTKIDAECRYLSTNNTKDIECECNILFGEVTNIDAECAITNTRSNKAQGVLTINEYVSSKYYIPSDNDTFVTDSNPEMSFYNYASLKQGTAGGNTYLTFISFDKLIDIPDIISRNILNSNLCLTFLSKFTGNIKVYELDSQFSEMNVSWISHPNKDNLIATQYLDGDTKVKINLGDYAKKVAHRNIVHNGFYIESDKFINVASSNSIIESNRPSIEIEYFDVTKNVKTNEMNAECNIQLVKAVDAELLLKLPFPVLDAECLFTQDSVRGEIYLQSTSIVLGECKWCIPSSKSIIGEMILSNPNKCAECIISPVEDIEAECDLLLIKAIKGQCSLIFNNSIDAEMTLKVAWTNEIDCEMILSNTNKCAECIISPVEDIEAEVDVRLAKYINCECTILFDNDIEAECCISPIDDIEAECKVSLIKQIDAECNMVYGKVIDAESDIRLIKEIYGECLTYHTKEIYSECLISVIDVINAEAIIIHTKDIDAECNISNVDYKEAECRIIVEDNTMIDAESKLIFSSTIDAEIQLAIIGETESIDVEVMLDNSEVIEAECNIIFLDTRTLYSECSIVFSKEAEAELRLIVTVKDTMDAECIVKRIETTSYLTIVEFEKYK